MLSQVSPLQSRDFAIHARYNHAMAVFDEKQEELEHYETMMGVPRGRLAVTMDTITDAMALVGQTGNGYTDHHEEPDGRERADPERNGRVAVQELLEFSGAICFSAAAYRRQPWRV